MTSRMLKAVRQNIVAWLALFVAMGGTSLAASHYIITSTKQLKPSVLRKLHGARGTTGAPGAAGKEGTAGPQGPAGRGEVGPRGPEGKEGREGKGEGTPGKEGKEGPAGKEGKEGPQGSARAYAHVTELATLEVANQKGFEGAKVERGEGRPEGVYCISGLSFAPQSVVATIDANESYAGLLTATLGIANNVIEGSSKCKAGTQITIETFEPAPFAGSEARQKRSDQGFYIMVN